MRKNTIGKLEGYKDVIKAKDLKDILDINLGKVYQLLNSGEIKAKKDDTGYWIIRKQSVAEYLDRIEETTNTNINSSDLINIRDRQGQMVVSSREVAQNFGKRHDHILRDVKNMMKNDSPQNWGQYFITSEYKDLSGKSNREYLCTRDGFTLLAMGFTGQKAIEWKIKYIDAFNKMEQTINEQGIVLPKDFSSACRMLADQFEENQRLNEQVLEMKPKTEYLDTLLKTDNLLTVTTIAKAYGMSAEAFNQLLHSLGIQWRYKGRNQKWHLYQEYTNEGYAYEQWYIDPETNDKHYSGLKWTNKGVKFLYELLNENGIQPLVEMKPEFGLVS
ncbi:Rha family transcriptional regulator [Eubacterium limosum]|uniref:Rha family transcriptional regulator n=1 Tax=Eubacterium limosum TaxID=1736 RepID=UPI0010643BDE|nr:Rha family transcriptional regulator [Eubacterium limosum]